MSISFTVLVAGRIQLLKPNIQHGKTILLEHNPLLHAYSMVKQYFKNTTLYYMHTAW
jgi:hypothetical protein